MAVEDVLDGAPATPATQGHAKNLVLVTRSMIRRPRLSGQQLEQHLPRDDGGASDDDGIGAGQAERVDEAETFRQTIWKRDPEAHLTQALTPERARQRGQLRVECAYGILPANRVRKVHRPCIAERWHEAERAARE